MAAYALKEIVKTICLLLLHNKNIVQYRANLLTQTSFLYIFVWKMSHKCSVLLKRVQKMHKQDISNSNK